MLSIGYEKELPASADEFHEALKEFEEERYEEVEKIIDGKKCICKRSGARREAKVQGLAKYTIIYIVEKILE